MMRFLSPRRYGGYVAVACQSGDLWLGVQQLANYKYDYNFVATAQVFTPTNFVPLTSDRIGSRFYFSQTVNNDLMYADVATPWSVTATTGWSISSGGGDIANDGTYIYRCGGVLKLNRMDLPFGTVTQPSPTGGQSRANAVVCLNGRVLVSSIYNSTINRSVDLGVNWTSGASSPAPSASSLLRIAADPSGSRVFCYYKLTADNTFYIKYSDDYGDTWSTSVYSFLDTTGDVIQNIPFTFARGKYRYMTSNGKNGSSADGLTWVAGADVPFPPVMVSYGVNKTIAICNNNRLYETTDDGGSWSLVTLPEATPSGSGVYARTVWIGNDLPICPPTTPTGNVWRVINNTSFQNYDGEYNFTNYTNPSMTGYTGLVSNITKKTGGYYYSFPTTNNGPYYSTDAIAWSSIGTGGVAMSGAGGAFASDGTYGYYASGIENLQRFALPFGTISRPSSNNLNRAQGIIIKGGVIYVASQYNQTCNYSSNQGATWTAGGSINAGQFFEAGGDLAHDESTIVCLYRDRAVATNKPMLAYSTNNGATWAVAYTFPTADALIVQGLIWTGSYFVAVVANGETAYSADGISWTAGATVPKRIIRLSLGIGKIAVGTAEVNVYESTNNGATWTEMPAPVVNTNPSEFASVYWIGDPP